MEGSGRYSQQQLDDAVDALTQPDRVARALRDVTGAAPQLQNILNQALEEGGFFGTAHGEEVRKALLSEEPDAAIRTLIAEETRLGMMIGVAVGFELARELPPLDGQED